MTAIRCRIVGVRQNENVFRHAHIGTRKRFGNEHGVPGLQDPGLLHGNIERSDGDAGEPRQHHRAFLGDVARPARTIDGERYRAPGFHHRLHFHQTALAAARTGAAHRHEPEAANHPRDVLTVVWAWKNTISGPPTSFENLTQYYATPEFWYFTK